MFERFTDRSRKVLALANQEAQRLNHDYVSVGDVFLGLLKEGTGVGATVLKNLDVDLLKARSGIEKLVPSGLDIVTSGKLPQTEEVAELIERAIKYSKKLNHNYVGTEHILGSFITQEGSAKKVLDEIELKPKKLEEELLGLLGKDIKEYSVLDKFSNEINDYWKIPRQNMNIVEFLDTCGYEIHGSPDRDPRSSIMKLRVEEQLCKLDVGRIGLTKEEPIDYSGVQINYDPNNKEQMVLALDFRDLLDDNKINHVENPPVSEVMKELEKPIEENSSLIERLRKK